MIDFENQTLTQEGKTGKIVEWKVKFQTPAGLMDNVQQVLEWFDRSDMRANDCVGYVSVALDEHGRSEIAV